MKIYNPTDIGDRNKLMILRLIKVYDGISRQEISKRMHLSAPAVSNNVAALIENGIVYENGCDDTSLGRKPRQLSYKGDLYYVISVELMPKKVRAGIADLYGEVQQWTEKEIIVENGVDEVLGQLDSAIDELLEKRKKDVDVIAIAVGVPALTGQNDLNDLFGTYLPEWKNVDLKEHILQKYNVEAIIVNDVELALIGERERGVGKKQTNIVYIKYGEGFAARAIVDGYLLKGNNMAAGELGYYLESLEEMTDEFVCPGRFEKKVCQNIFSECGEKNGLSDLILRAEQGDEAADAIVKKIIRKIAVVIANTVLMLNSEMVILGGDSEIFTEENIVAEGGAVAEVDQYNGTASLVYNGQYPGVWVNLPAEITDNQFQTVEITYENQATDADFGAAIRYATSKGDEGIIWPGSSPFASGETTKTIALDFTKKFAKIKIFAAENLKDAKLIIKAVVLKREAGATAPTATPKPTALPTTAPIDVTYGWNADETEYTLPLTEETVVKGNGTEVSVDTNAKTATITYDGAYPDAFLNMPGDLSDTKFSSIIIKYDRLTEQDSFGYASRYTDNKSTDVNIKWATVSGAFAPDAHEVEIPLDKTKDLYQFKIFGNACDSAGFIIKAVILKK